MFLALLIAPGMPNIGPAPCGWAAEPDGREVLTRHKGLQQLPGSEVWINAAESRLRDLAKPVDEDYRTAGQLQRSLETRIGQNRLAWESALVQREALRQSLAGATGDEQRQRIQQQIREIDERLIDPVKLGAQPDVRATLIEWTNRRQRLTLAVLQIPRWHEQMLADYRQLGGDPQVSAALRALGSNQRLGPLEGGYRGLLRRLGQVESAVCTPWVPLYLQNQQARFGGILNEQVPVTFTWQESSEPTLVTASMVELAGLAPEDGEPQSLAVGPRRLTARRIRVPTLRLGGVVLRDAPAFVLPADAEDLGARISSAAFADHRAQIEPERLRLSLAPAGGTASPR
jgi:hypothetical protein